MILLLKLSFLLFRPGDELLMFLAFGVEGLVAECFPDGSPVFQKLFCGFAEIGGTELFPDILHSLRARMQHVFLIEAIITKLIVHDFVSREITHHSRIRLHQFICSQLKRCLRKLAPVVAVFGIADGADGYNHLFSFQQINGLLQIPCTLLHAQFPFLEKALRTLLAVIHNLARFLQNIHVVRTQRKHSHTRQNIQTLLHAFLHGMEIGRASCRERVSHIV